MTESETDRWSEIAPKADHGIFQAGLLCALFCDCASREPTASILLMGCYSLLLKIAATTRGLRRPWNTAKTRNGF
jgi:hypothetical protein